MKQASTEEFAASITEKMYYPWKAKYPGIEISDAKRLKQLEDQMVR